MKFDVKFDNSMMAECTKIFLWNRYYKRVLPWILLEALIIAYCFYDGFLIMGYILTGTIAVISLFLAKVYHNWMSMRFSLLSLLGDGNIKYEIDEISIQIASKIGTSKIEWGSIQKVMVANGWVFFIYMENGFISVPQSKRDGKVMDLIKSKVA